jgi:hypothetical protein
VSPVEDAGRIRRAEGIGSNGAATAAGLGSRDAGIAAPAATDRVLLDDLVER